jgi:hypothetical protein
MYSVQLIQAHNSVHLLAEGPYFIRQLFSVLHRRSSAATVGGCVKVMRYRDLRADIKWQRIAVELSLCLSSPLAGPIIQKRPEFPKECSLNTITVTTTALIFFRCMYKDLNKHCIIISAPTNVILHT